MEKTTLFLMTEKGFEVLKAIINNFSVDIIDCLIIGADKNVQNDFSEEILNLANQHQIKVYKREDDFTLQTKHIIAISWRWIINSDEESTKIIVLHDSLLPKYRGFSPLVSQLINKENTIGVTAIIANKEFDRGNIITQSSVPVNYPIKINEAINKITPLYQNLIVEVLNKVIKGEKLSGKVQDEKLATYSLWRDEEDYKIDWSDTSDNIKIFIDALGFPYQGASTLLNGKLIRVLDVHIETDVDIENRTPGKVLFIKDQLYPIVVCGAGLLKLITVVDDKTKSSILPLKKFRTRFL